MYTKQLLEMTTIWIDAMLPQQNSAIKVLTFQPISLEHEDIKCHNRKLIMIITIKISMQTFTNIVQTNEASIRSVSEKAMASHEAHRWHFILKFTIKWGEYSVTHGEWLGWFLS